MVVLIAAFGVSGSGKTTTLEYLISKLTAEGFKVGAIKHIHRENFTIDKEGTNTWRFSKAGSKVTVAVSAEEIAVIEKTKVALSDLDRIISELEHKQLDIVFIEGFHSFISKRPDILKIVTAKTAEDLNKTLSESVPPVLAVTGLIAKTKLPPSEVPYLNLPDEGPKLLELVKEYLASVKK
ncbi:MAG: molybdopterin-guanine dinucleotide biosynthesis protein B [Candidatus Bathyarchaeota archaeon]|nr:molybdopterin-guanine dinucleotide biosynthesis protein B [Candidatus Bathyarchaeota archaeon]